MHRILYAALMAALMTAPITAQGDEPRFNRDVRPILSDKCFVCHGPDAKAKGVPLRLDSAEAALVPVKSGAFVERITTEKKASRMPPAHVGNPLTAGEVSVLRRWAEAGAPWEKHWAYQRVTRPEVPVVGQKEWVRNPVDAFVLGRLEKEGLRPSPEAGREKLMRRAAFDLTGLPPELKDLDSGIGYEAYVDQLLASPRYAERMTARWLDVARYADSNGYQSDGERNMYRWRDWVLAAYASNMPFDQFTVEQLAGDLLPNATVAQKVATGFHRNHRGNGEGGIVPEEYLAEYAADRVETTGAVWMGSTIGCARCHNHKYDPFTQKEFYQLFAFFNNIPERGRYFKHGNTPPLVSAPTPDDEARSRELENAIAGAERRWSLENASVREDASKAPAGWTSGRDRMMHWKVGGLFDGSRMVDAGAGDFRLGYFNRFTIAARITPKAGDGMIVTRAADELEPEKGWGMGLHNGKLRVYFAQRWLDDALHVESAEPIVLGREQLVAVTYDATRVASGIRLYVDGRPVATKVLVDDLNQEFHVPDAVRVGGGGGPMEREKSRFRGRIDEIWVYGKDFVEADFAGLMKTDGVRAWREEFAPENVRNAWRELETLREKHLQATRALPTVMVMQELEKRNPAHVLLRGAYDQPGERVSPGVPEVLGRLPGGGPADRLALARWLVSREHPLTARVTVNRYWQMIWGRGLVETAEDFGSQGSWPANAELLDWLAAEYMESGWDTKKLLKTIVTSAAYRQDSRMNGGSDPLNRLLARGPRLRLGADAVRDQALAVSGLLVDKMGGPSVKPYQPAGLWKELLGTDYVADHGEKLYRRSVYTYWRRTSPPPSMMTFDAAGREICSVRESRTNTPLQALNLMNDVQFLEAARMLAERMMKEGGGDALAYGFRLATSRLPKEGELAVLRASLAQFRDEYAGNLEAAKKLLAVGESARDEKLPVAEHAAHMAVASLLLNLDEVLTKQ
jgi:hypothetical protein